MRAWLCAIGVAACSGPMSLDEFCGPTRCPNVPRTWSAAQTREAWGQSSCGIHLFTCQLQRDNVVVGQLGMAGSFGIDSAGWYFYDNSGSLFEIIATSFHNDSSTGRNDPADDTPDVDACLALRPNAGNGFVLGCPP